MRLSGPPPSVLPARWPGPEERAAQHGLICGRQNSAHVCDDGSDDGLCPPRFGSDADVHSRRAASPLDDFEQPASGQHLNLTETA
jgi:hypothetical protein